MVNATTSRKGVAMTNTSGMGIFAITMNGNLREGVVHIMVDINDDGKWVQVGNLTDRNPAKLIMLPSGSKCNAELDCDEHKNTYITVAIAS